VSRKKVHTKLTVTDLCPVGSLLYRNANSSTKHGEYKQCPLKEQPSSATILVL
jgi:hypothetical protein